MNTMREHAPSNRNGCTMYDAERRALTPAGQAAWLAWGRRCAGLVMPDARTFDTLGHFLRTRFDIDEIGPTDPRFQVRTANLLCDPYMSVLPCAADDDTSSGEPDTAHLHGCCLPLTPRNLRLLEDSAELARARDEGCVCTLFWDEDSGCLGGSGAACHLLLSEVILYLGVSSHDIGEMTPRYFSYIEELSRRGALPPFIPSMYA